MPYLLSDAKSFLADRNRGDTSAKAIRDYVRVANTALGWIHAARRWAHMRKLGSVQFAAPYVTGTAAATVGSTAVTGSGTTWTAAMIGRFILFGGDRRPYFISARGSNTGITLAEAYHGVAGSDPVDFAAGSYQILDLCESLPSDFLELDDPAIGTVQYKLLPTLNLNTILLAERWTTYLGNPQQYAIQRVLNSDGTTTAKLWVWPVPGTFNDLTFWYYAAPAPLAIDADSFQFPVVQGAQGMIEAYLGAALKDFNNEDATAQKQNAAGLAMRVATVLEPIGGTLGREPYGIGRGRLSVHATYGAGIVGNG